MTLSLKNIPLHRLNSESPHRSAKEAFGHHLSEARVREAGGPEDEALYTCSCGALFTAKVVVGVDCPNCGMTQTW